jgi:hypothetical protein
MYLNRIVLLGRLILSSLYLQPADLPSWKVLRLSSQRYVGFRLVEYRKNKKSDQMEHLIALCDAAETLSSLSQAHVYGPDDNTRPRGKVQFGEDIRNVCFDSPLTDDQLLSNPTVGHASGN